MALSDSLISYWSLEEASGTRVDAVASSANDLTDNNTVTQNTGKVANCAQFTSANSESLSIADNASLSTGDIDFSVACWIYFDTKAADRGFVSKFNPTGNQREYQIDYATATDRIRFVGSNNGTATVMAIANNLGVPATATWYFVVGRHDSVGNTVSICVNDGTVDSTAHTTGIFDSTATFRIGCRSDAANFMNGRIDEVGFWKRLLSAAEITELYNSGNGRDYAYIAGAATGQPMALRQSLMLTGARRFGRGIS